MMRADYGMLQPPQVAAAKAALSWVVICQTTCPVRSTSLSQNLFVRVNSAVDNQKVPIGQKLDRIGYASRSHG